MPESIGYWHSMISIGGRDPSAVCVRHTGYLQGEKTIHSKGIALSELEAVESELIVDQTEQPSEDEALPGPKYEIFSYPADTTIKGYLEQWNNNQLYIPEFQRAYVWDQPRASKLIESFLLGLPVPPVFLYKPAGSKTFWIIDGQQRILSLINYQKGVFNEGKFRLKGVDPRWEGKAIDDLEPAERFSLETAVLRAIVIQQTQPNDHSSIYHIFERLNTGGIRLNAMEVRQCVYISNFLLALGEWNADKNWQSLLGVTKPDKRLRDRELALRVIAFSQSKSPYEKPMKKFLNDCAIYFRVLEEKDKERARKEVAAVGDDFLSACMQIATQLGPKPFHLKGRLNFSALDAVVSTVMMRGRVDNLADKFVALVADPLFVEDVSFNTSDESVVKRRFETTAKYLA